MPARHRVDPVHAEPIPKPGGGTRTLAHLGPRDAAVWGALGTRLRPLVERRLGATVLADLADPRGLAPRLRRARLLAAAMAGRLDVVSTDVRSFYPSVEPTLLYRSLRAIDAGHEDAALAADMTDGWGSEGLGGLPIGPPASAVLAGAVLLPVDAALPGPFLRWVDDYLLPASALDRFDEALGVLGLARSEQKTRHGRRGLWGTEPKGAYGLTVGNVSGMGPAVSRGRRTTSRGGDRRSGACT